MSGKVQATQGGFVFERREGYLEGVGSPKTAQGVMQAIPHIAEAMAETGCHKVLVDFTTAEGPVSLMERLEMAEVLAATTPRTMKLAAVVTRQQLDPQRFGETIARNKGVNMRVFLDRDRALRWLLSDER